MLNDPELIEMENTPQSTDVVKILMEFPRRCLENPTVSEARANGNFSETELHLIGLLEHLTEEYGYVYGGELLNPLITSLIDDGQPTPGILLLKELIVPNANVPATISN